MTAATTPTMADVKHMAADARMHQAANAYLMAKANAQLWRDRVEPHQRGMLATIGATYARGSRKTGPITEPADAWLMSDEQHREWCDRLDALYRELGWLTATDEPGVCPALMAEKLERKAARAVLTLAAEHVTILDPDTLICAGIEKYHEGIRIVCGLIVNHSTYQRPRIGGAA